MAVRQTNSAAGSRLTSGVTSRATALELPWSGPVRGAGPANQQLATMIRGEILAGRLLAGDTLPPSRVLAEELGVSRWVVTQAYDQLSAEGYLAARVGSGTVVAATGAPGRGTPAAGAPLAGSGVPVAGPVAPQPDPAQEPMFDLSPAVPDLSTFPRAAWRACLTKALARAGDAELGRPAPLGVVSLRLTMADYLRRVRAIDVTPDQVLITQGVGDAVQELCHHLRSRGVSRVAVEDPGWPRMPRIARIAGLQVVPVPVDDDGLILGRLIEQDGDAPVGAVFTMPTHQFPTGRPMSPERRIGLLEWANRRDAWIVEDDYDAEFRYDRHPVGAIAALGPDRVVYLGSASKTLSPGSQLGWLVAPPALAGDLAANRTETMRSLAPNLDQLALVELITSGGYDRHLRRMRRHYRDRRAALLAALLDLAPGRPGSGLEAGLHVLWQLPLTGRRTEAPEEAEDRVVKRCRRRGLLVRGLSEFRIRATVPGDRRMPAALVLGCAGVPVHRSREIAALVADAAS